MGVNRRHEQAATRASHRRRFAEAAHTPSCEARVDLCVNPMPKTSTAQLDIPGAGLRPGLPSQKTKMQTGVPSADVAGVFDPTGA